MATLRITLRLAALFLLLASLAPVQAAEPSKPNIVIFLADDLGYGDLGCNRHPIMQTPNLDVFVKQGTWLTRCYAACAVCSSSRSAIQLTAAGRVKQSLLQNLITERVAY